MALGAAATSAAWLPMVDLFALLCLCVVAQPQGGEGQHRPPPREQPLLGEAPMPVRVFMVNVAQTPMDLFWIGQKRKHQQVLEPNQLTRFETFVGHDFEVADQNAGQSPNAAAPFKVEVRILEKVPSTTEIAKLWVCERQEEQAKAIIACKQEKLEYKGGLWNEHVHHMKKSCNGLLEKHPEDAAYFCNHDYSQWSLAQCLYDTAPTEFAHIHAPKQKNNHDGVVKDHSHVRRFTMVGHKVDRIPADIFESLRKHWQEDRLKLSKPENNDRFSVVAPGCKYDTWVMPVQILGEPRQELMKKVIDTVQPLIAKWASLKTEDIEFTAIYGLRMYKHGSSFPLHRDRPHTHILSAIIEIGVLDLDHPDPNFNGNSSWPLQIYDHSGALHKHEYKPGQMIFYESFTCPHGRPTRFQGREIASVFVHFRPKGWGPKDWDKELMEKSRKNEL